MCTLENNKKKDHQVVKEKKLQKIKIQDIILVILQLIIQTLKA